MTPKERRLERSIAIAQLEAMAGQTPEDRRVANERLAMLKAQRSLTWVREIKRRESPK